MLGKTFRKHPKICRGLIYAARKQEASAHASRAQGRRILPFERLGAIHARKPARLRGKTITNHSSVDVRVAYTKPEATQGIVRPHLATVLDSFSRMLIETSVWVEEESAPAPGTPKGGAQISNSETVSDLMPIKPRR